MLSKRSWNSLWTPFRKLHPACLWRKLTRLGTFIPDIGTHPPGMAFARTARVRLNHLRTGVGRFPSCLYKWDAAPYAGRECGAEKQTVDHVILHCPIHQQPHGVHSPDSPGRCENWMAVKHLPRDLVRPSSGEELAQTMTKSMSYSLVDFHVSTNTSVQNWFLVFWFLLMCSSVLNRFLSLHLLFR